ncbi:MAG: hypothetical protein HZC23_07845 [Rhodocyclales bacterium]|nr:hypothetical protein [Rhodocyclales bacterium]
MLFEQLIRCVVGLFEGLLWLILTAVFLLGIFLIDSGLVVTGLLFALGVAGFAACAFRNRG